MIPIYGIKNCDPMKKAMRWLDEHGVDYRFHDYRKDGLDSRQLKAWEKDIGCETRLNRRGQLWRNRPELSRDSINRQTALRIMQDTPAIIKRPLLELGDRRVGGFKAEDYSQLF